MTKIELIATDGTSQRRLLWIDAKKNGVYCGFCDKGRDIHNAYHSDGNMFQTADGQTQKIARYHSLSGFKGIWSMGTFAFVADLSRMAGISYKMRRLDAAIYLDTRSFVRKSSFVNCIINLLEPKRFDMLNGLTKLPGLRQIQIFTNYNPWILVSILAAK